MLIECTAFKMKVFLVFLVVIGSGLAETLISSDEIEKLFTKHVLGQLTAAENKTLHELVEIVQWPLPVSRANEDVVSEIRMTLECVICRSAFSALFAGVREGQTDEQLTETITVLCASLGIASQAVCHGAVGLNMPILTHIVRTTPEATPGTFCALVLQNSGDPNVCPLQDERFEWTVDLPALPETGPEPPLSTSGLKIALITDAHLDPLYEPYGAADCDEPTCCRKGQQVSSSTVDRVYFDETIVENSIKNRDGRIFVDVDSAQKVRESKMASTKTLSRNQSPAGYWGDYRNCDSPIWAYDNVIDEITANNKDIDVVYYIGDTIDHFVWETTYSLINDMNIHIVSKLRAAFGDDVPVIATIGNHESQPTNQFAPARVTGDKINTTWLYEALADKWGQYLPEEAQETLRTSGDFSMLVRPGLRAISINNNVAYKYNWWLVYDPLDAKNHLDFLVQELSKAEAAGEKVHILTHIPPGVHDLTRTWTREYNRIVNRFSSTIAAEFNGHTHSDEFKVFYDLADSARAINVAWGAGSATSYNNYNLNYKIVSVGTQQEVTDIQTYVYNLTEANLTPNRPPHWFQLYDVRQRFGLADLSAASLGDLVVRMVTTDKHLLQLYNAFYPKLSDPRLWCAFNENCSVDNLCKVVVTVLWERAKCDELRSMYFS